MKLILILICIFLSGCKNISDIEPNNDLKYESYGFTTNTVYESNVYEIINDYDEFIIKTNNDLFSSEVVNYLKKYDENYFKNSSLIMVYIGSGGYVSAKVSNVKVESDIEITIEQDKYEILNEVLSGNLLFIEINNKNINSKDILIHYVLGYDHSFSTSRSVLRTMQFLKYEKKDGVIYHYFQTLDTNEEVMLYTKDNKTLFEIDYKVGQNYDFELLTHTSDSLTTKKLLNNSKVVSANISDSIKNEELYNPLKTYSGIIYTSKDYIYEIFSDNSYKYYCKNNCVPSLKINDNVYDIQKCYFQGLITFEEVNNHFDLKKIAI